MVNYWSNLAWPAFDRRVWPARQVRIPATVSWRADAGIAKLRPQLRAWVRARLDLGLKVLGQHLTGD